MKTVQVPPDIQTLFSPKFDRNEQLELVASVLEHLRTAFATQWRLLGEGSRAPEFKAIVSNLVRVADQSVAAQATVAYLTEAALDELNAMADARTPRRAFKKDLKAASKFRNEHATPVELIVRTITLPQNCEVPIIEILRSMCCRVLVTIEESGRIDGKHAWKVPSTLLWTDDIKFGLRTMDPSLIPLIRYHEVDSKLARSLVPLSPVHADLIVRFRTLVDAKTAEELVQGFQLCWRTRQTAFQLPDDIYQGISRRSNNPV
ncbi:hypothetical protein [Massilia sp. BJB1822]|uniref:hypothetical protein n=1 Tax=Massilia sp. BJB1822 TaxID=2744470 RepID=UPI0015935588|nr:hypothetical protein [Massilia sp. BJB1822]NVD97954.1 hypothetical protein [Massilia sp. BJB1822]